MEDCMNRYSKVLAAVAIGFVSLMSYVGTMNAQQSAVTAIDIVLEPDATMVHHAEAVNA
jgi:hypothetical protein